MSLTESWQNIVLKTHYK